MKNTKRFISLVLAVVMICAVAVTVSAATYGSYHASVDYEDVCVEVFEDCSTFTFSSCLLENSGAYTLGSSAKVYGWTVENNDGEFEVVDGTNTQYLTYNATGITFASLSESHPLCYIHHVDFVHKIDGTIISKNTLYPSYA